MMAGAARWSETKAKVEAVVMISGRKGGDLTTSRCEQTRLEYLVLLFLLAGRHFTIMMKVL